MATIKDLTKLGFAVGIAHGDVATEETALAAAQQNAAPGVVFEQAGRVTQDTLNDLDAAGKLPTTADDRQALAAEIARRALEMLQTHADEKVAFHERALAIAQESPDVWVVQHTVNVDGNDQLVAQLYIACKADGTGWDAEAQAQLDALAVKSSFDERVFQATNAEAITAAHDLAAAGATVIRDPGVSSFTVDGKTVDAEAVIALADKAQP